MLGHFLLGLFAHILVQRKKIEGIPKTHTGKWRLITDLSYMYPLGYNMNHIINPVHYSLAYTTV